MADGTKSVEELVNALARSRSLFDEFKRSRKRDAWLGDRGYQAPAGVAATLGSLSFEELKAMVKARNAMDKQNVETTYRLQMV